MNLQRKLKALSFPYLECAKVCGCWASALGPELLLEEGARGGAITKAVWHLLRQVGEVEKKLDTIV